MSKFIEVHYLNGPAVLINTNAIRDISKEVGKTRICYKGGKGALAILVKDSYEDIKRQLIGGSHENSHSGITSQQDVEN